LKGPMPRCHDPETVTY